MAQVRMDGSAAGTARARLPAAAAPLDSLAALLRAERQVTVVRWIGIGVALVAAPLFLQGAQRMAVIGICIAAAIYNVVFERYIIPHRPRWLTHGYLTTVGDIVLAGAVIAMTGGLQSEFYLVYFLIAVVAAVRFGGRAAVMATGVIMVTYLMLGARSVATLMSGEIGMVLFRLGFVAATALFAGFVADRARAAEREVQDAYDDTLAALSTALDQRDTDTRGHSQRVTAYALALGRDVGLSYPELAALSRGALLHDIGKIGVPDAILRKAGRLTEPERATVREHPRTGARILRGIPFLKDALPVVLHHHERWDGTGYPDGQRGEEIDLLARVFAVADAYDAMTSTRTYRPGCSHEQAIAEILANAGTQFDPAIARAFAALPPESFRAVAEGAEAAMPRLRRGR